MVDPSQQDIYRALIGRVATGDREAFSLLYDRVSRPLFSLACEMLGDAAEAEDAMQEVALQIWRRAANYDASKSSVFSWSVMMMRSKAIDRLRARGRRERVVSGSVEDVEAQPELASESEDASDTTARRDEATRVRSALQMLPQEQRRAIEMAFFTELTHAEIAAQNDEPLGTIKARIRRGLLRLRETLK